MDRAGPEFIRLVVAVIALAWAPSVQVCAAQQAASPPDVTPLLEKALAQEIRIRKERMGLFELSEKLHRDCRLRCSLPPNAFGAWVQLRPGPQPVREVLEALSKSLDAIVEPCVFRGRVLLCVWEKEDPREVAGLWKLAESEDEQERAVAARWLPATGGRESLRKALALLGDPSRRVRLFAAHSIVRNWAAGFGWRAAPLAEAAPPGTGQAVAEELERIAEEHRADGGGRARFLFMQLAAQLGDAAALPALEKLAHYEAVERDQMNESSTISQSLRAIVAIGGERAEKFILAMVEKCRERARPYVLQKLCALDGPAVRPCIVQALCAKLPGFSEVTALQAAACQLDEGERPWLDEPLAAAWVRGPRQEPGAKTMTEAQKESLAWAFRENAALALVRNGNQNIIKDLKDLLQKDWDDARQANLCWRLHFEGGQRDLLLPCVEKLAASPKEQARNTALNLLGHIGTERQAPLLRRLLEQDTNRGRRSLAVRALAAIGGEEAEAEVLRCLKSDDVHLRAAAAQYAGESGLKAAAPLLRGALKDPETRVRMLALKSLGELGDAGALDLIIEAARRPNERLDNKTGQTIQDPYRPGDKAIEQLVHLAGPQAMEELVRLAREGNGTALTHLLSARAPAFRRAARELLEKDGPAVAATLEKVQNLRPSAPNLMHSFTAEAVASLLATRVSHAEPKAGRSAALQLQSLSDPRAAAPLAKFITAGNAESVRLAAATALAGRWDTVVDPRAAKALLDAERNDTSAGIRDVARQALISLGAAGGPEAAAWIKAHGNRMPVKTDKVPSMPPDDF